MCGICGIVEPAGLRPDDTRRVRTMAQMIAHRGPDGDGFWDADGASLGHRRLAIIDVAGGSQPLFNESNRIGLVFNGEIYNYKELRGLLVARGHRFRSETDSEVIVHGYEEWGDGVVARLRGMFAFALWDTAGRLLLARDRLGIKPLYYHTSDGGRRIVFASEIKALFADEAVPREFNEPRLAEYLAFRCVAGAETMFAHVRELEPGMLAVVDRDGFRTRLYWKPSLSSDGAEPLEIAAAHGRELLRDAVSSHLMSDVGVGSITSGGLDSSLVSALAAESLAHIDTFCVGFADPKLDERAEARSVASRIGSRHHDIEADPATFSDELERLTWFHDEPLAHPNAVPMYLIFRFARDQVGIPVLLSGEGADELFGGYGWYTTLIQRERLSRIPGLRALASAAPFGRIATLGRVLDPAYPVWANAVSRAAELQGLGLDPAEAVRTRVDESPSDLDGYFLHDQRTYLPPLLQRQDRMSMATGLEARVPFLDHVLVEWANSLPASTKLSGGVRKRLLKEMATGILPRKVSHRKKVGFALPLGQWLSDDGPLGDRVQALLEGAGTAADLARAAFGRQTPPSPDIVWSLLALDLWESVFLSANSPSLSGPWSSPPTGTDRMVVGR